MAAGGQVGQFVLEQQFDEPRELRFTTSLEQVRANFPKEFNEYLDLLPKFVTIGFKMPKEPKPEHLLIWRNNTNNNICNASCMFTTIGLTVVLAGAYAVNKYLEFTTPKM